MTTRQPFAPSYGTNIVVNPAAASAVATIPAGSNQVRVVNSGAAIGYFRLYNSQNTPAPVATTADCPVLPGTAVVVTRDQGHDRLAHISSAGTTFQVMVGEGC